MVVVVDDNLMMVVDDTNYINFLMNWTTMVERKRDEMQLLKYENKEEEEWIELRIVGKKKTFLFHYKNLSQNEFRIVFLI